MKMMRFFLLFHFNGAPMEWNWQGKTEVHGENRVSVPLFPPQIPHGPTRDQTRASAVRGRRQTTWAMARPFFTFSIWYSLIMRDQNLPELSFHPCAFIHPHLQPPSSPPLIKPTSYLPAGPWERISCRILVMYCIVRVTSRCDVWTAMRK
jgi:hypothetical protein